MPRTLLQIVPKLGVDMGRATTRFWLEGRGVVLEEASCIAIDDTTGKLIAVGNQAAQLHQRLGEGVRVEWLIQDGLITDSELVIKFLHALLGRVLPYRLIGPIVLLSLPSGTAVAMESALVKIWHSLGALEVSVIAQPLAAAIGSGVPIAEASGALIAVLGAGVLEAAGVALGSQIVARKSLQGGEYIDDLIMAELRQNQHFLVSKEVAQLLKEKLLSVKKSMQPQTVIGKSTLSGAPQELTIKTALLHEPAVFLAQEVSGLVKEVLRVLSPAVTTDVVTKGLLLAGGLSQVAGLDDYLVQRLGIPVSVVEDPKHVVINGIGEVLTNYLEFKGSLGYRQIK